MDYKSAIEKRLVKIFTAFKDGKDAPPAMRYRTEGFMLAALESGSLTAAELLSLQRTVISKFLGEDACIDVEVGKIPSIMVRAPVKQTTKD